MNFIQKQQDIIQKANDCIALYHIFESYGIILDDILNYSENINNRILILNKDVLKETLTNLNKGINFIEGSFENRRDPSIKKIQLSLHVNSDNLTKLYIYTDHGVLVCNYPAQVHSKIIEILEVVQTEWDQKLKTNPFISLWRYIDYQGGHRSYYLSKMFDVLPEKVINQLVELSNFRHIQ